MAAGAADSWYHEKESAWLYGVVAAAEPDPVKRDLFVKLAAAAEAQAACWLATRPELKQKLEFTPALRARIVALLVRSWGPRRLRAALAAMKLRGLSIYSGPPMPASHAIPTTVADVGKRHASVGGKLRAAVFGASDGLVSNASLVMGVAAAGEYVSVRSQREELGLNPDDLGSPFAAAGSSFVAFATGATVPLIPFFVGLNGLEAVYGSAGLTAFMLFAVGIALSLFTGRGAFRGGMRMLLIGGGAGVAAWGVGKLLGASLAG